MVDLEFQPKFGIIRERIEKFYADIPEEFKIKFPKIPLSEGPRIIEFVPLEVCFLYLFA